ncbi:MAG TPA: hypothetical protein VNZ62_18215 [Capillimicrobium sp.]|nr:hypothetical protein [Capillimicrobium sp.]
MRRDLDLSIGLVAIGAIAVLVSLFLDWYEPGLAAWDAFEVVDWLLLALAVAALALAGSAATRAAGPGAAGTRLAWICGIVAFLVIAQILDPPPAVRGADRAIGAWIALGGSALMVAGAVLAIAQISVTIDVSERRRRTAAVDARNGADAPDDAPSASGRGANLWTPPAGGEERERDDDDDVPAPDPDRTQPLPPVPRPDDEKS